jgi:hypothetical protein
MIVEIINDSTPIQITLPAQGPQGIAATIAVGAVSTLAPGSPVSVVNSGTPEEAVFDIGIPRGNTGAAGAQGPTGLNGSDLGVRYQFNSAVVGDPTAGHFLFNNATFASATSISISETDADGNSLAALLAAIDDSTSTKKALVVFKKENGTAYFFGWLTSALTDNGAYDSFSFTPIVAVGAITNGDVCRFMPVIVSDKGDTGAAGPAGPTPAARVRAATTANIVIATALNNADTLDGVTLATGDLVLVKNQSAPAENGIYVVGVSPARHSDFDTYDENPAALVAVMEGTAGADTLWLCTSDKGGVLGVAAITFVQVDPTITDATLPFTDITTNNASTTKHGFLKKLSNVAAEWMNGQGAWAAITGSDLSLSDVTTNDASITKHGFLKKLSNVATQFMNGVGAWAVPPVIGSRQRLYFIASDGTNWSKPSDANFIGVTVICVGPGGGSGGSSNTNSRIGGGGGGGAWSLKTILAASLGATEALAIGAGGTAGTSTTAGAAGNKATAFGAHLSAGAGGGGNAGDGTNSQAAGGAATGGDINLDGLPAGYPGLSTDSYRGSGGCVGTGALWGSRTASLGSYRLNNLVAGVPWAGAGAASPSETTAESPGFAGGFPGGGASGGMRIATTSRAGAAGGNGFILVVEHYGA